MNSLPLPLLALLLLLCTCAPAEKQTDQETPVRPNILFVLTDDQGIGDLSRNGNDSIRTPNMDRLLADGVYFQRFYVSPVCAPTRASFLSGQYHPRTGAIFVTRRAETMDSAVVTLPEHLRAGGYRTGLFGKWHNGATAPYDPASQGFDEFLGFTLGHFNDYFGGELQNEHRETIPFDGDLTDILTDTAAAFMLAPDERPFFAMLAYQAPHTPVQVADDHWNAVKTRGLTDYNTGIYAMIESIDEQLGRLREQLERAGKWDNTIVVFATDNGPNGDRYRMGLKGTKGQVDEGAVRVPFGIKIPGDHHTNGQEMEFPAAHIDLLPTLLDYADLPVPAGLDGTSLRPLLELTGEGRSPGDRVDSTLRFFAFRNIFTFKQGYEFRPYPGSMRNASHLYVLRGKDQHELYALRRDTAQEHNLYLDRPPKSVGDQDWTDADIEASRSRQMAADYAAFAAMVARPDLVAPPIKLDAGSSTVRLLAHEGEPTAPTAFTDQYGWANDWVVNLDLPGMMQWPVRTDRDLAFTATVRYHLEATEGKQLVLAVDNGSKFSVALPPFMTTELPVADRTPRKEVLPRRWGRSKSFEVVVPAGARRLTLYAHDAGAGLWVKELRLERK